MWKKAIVSIDGVIKETAVNFEGPKPGKPGTVEWDAAIESGAVVVIAGETYYATTSAAVAGLRHISISSEPPPPLIDWGPRPTAGDDLPLQAAPGKRPQKTKMDEATS